MPKGLDTPRQLTSRYRVNGAEPVELEDYDPAETLGLNLKAHADAWLAKRTSELNDLQQILYADRRWALLLIFQSMDAGGKDSVIRHVLSGVSPEGCQVYSYKSPSTEELSHDYLWRTSKNVPERGHIGLFSRSYYEEVLVVRVHPEMLRKQGLPDRLVTDSIWSERLQDICNFESYLGRNGFVVRKFFLHVSKKEQKKRFLKRLTRADKHWKFAEDDMTDRARWDDFTRLYEEVINRTATASAPWYIVPADDKRFTRLVVVSAIIEALQSLDLAFPKPDAKKQEAMRRARATLRNKA